MGGYLGSDVATQVDGYTRDQSDARYPQMTGATGAAKIPSGTTAQRPSSPAVGYTRFNTDIGQAETYNGSAWVTSGGLLMQSVQTANFTAVAGNSYPVNTTAGAITVTLPASPLSGQQVCIFDYAGTAATNYIAINPNGGKINGLAANAVTSTARASSTLVYVDSTQGWVDVAVGNAAYIPQSYSVDYLVIAGGGGGFNYGGGGSGGYRCSVSGESSGGGASAEAQIILNNGTAYTVTVGAGGASQSTGSSSSFSAITSVGGGGGGFSGGSGGGATNWNQTGASGTSGQGYAGGNGSGGSQYRGGGGGGAGGAGGTGTTNPSVAGNSGGNGVASSITGSSVVRAGGGGGGTYDNGQGSGTSLALGSGGSGGGGGGGRWTTYTIAAGSGAANTGSGGGGGGGVGTGTASDGAGGSGIAIIRYAGAQRGTGGTVTSSGGYTIHTFTSSGTFTA